MYFGLFENFADEKCAQVTYFALFIIRQHRNYVAVSMENIFMEYDPFAAFFSGHMYDY